MNRAETFEVVPSKRWVNHETGQTASIYGAVPYVTIRDRYNWSIEVRGYTVRNVKTGVVGIGRMPWKTEAEALSWIAEV